MTQSIRRELDRVNADVLGPRGDERIKTRPIAGEQRARGLLEVRKIARHRRHEAVSDFARTAHAVRAAAGAARLLDQLAQRDRSAAGLTCEPVPMARQQRDLARDDAKLRTAGAARGFGFLRWRGAQLRALREP